MARFSVFLTLFHLSLTFFRPEVPFKAPKHDAQNWFTANNNNGENYDVIRFAC